MLNPPAVAGRNDLTAAGPRGQTAAAGREESICQLVVKVLLLVKLWRRDEGGGTRLVDDPVWRTTRAWRTTRDWWMTRAW